MFICYAHNYVCCRLELHYCCDYLISCCLGSYNVHYYHWTFLLQNTVNYKFYTNYVALIQFIIIPVYLPLFKYIGSCSHHNSMHDSIYRKEQTYKFNMTKRGLHCSLDSVS